jgi:6-phosphogluconolactonase
MKVFSLAAMTALALGAAVAHPDNWDWHLPHQGPRAVYTETNAADGNEILVFHRRSDGELKLAGSASTRGRGTGAGLGNQGALALRGDGRRLYAVNAGSNDISVFGAAGGRLWFIEKVSSGGTQPISLTLHDDLLYVLNAGGEGNITGFYIGDDRRLRPIPGSTRPLSGSATGPAQISFNTTGDVLVVTEKSTNKIDFYDVEDGVAEGPFVRASNGMTPFGFAFDRRDRLIVSEAFGGAPNASAMSSYDVDDAESPPELVSASVPTHQTAACWVAVTKNGRFAYTTNTGSGTVTGYGVARHGALSLLNANGVTGRTGPGSAPIDLTFSPDSRFLFVLSAQTGTIVSFRLKEGGGLANVSTAHDIPASASGLVVH